MNNDMFGDDAALDPELALAAVGEGNPSKWEGTLQLMYQAVGQALGTDGASKADIERLAPVVTMHLCTALGGSVSYIPRGDVVRRALRDTRLYDDYVGTAAERGLSVPELARKYHVAVQTVYEIIARQKAIRRRAAPDLFGFGGAKG